jgi:hypothetical protein
MEPLDDFLEKQRNLAPPESRTSDIERYVLRRLAPQPSRRARFSIAFAVTGLCVIAMLVVLSLPKFRAASSARQPDFVESVVLLNDHTCIWLESVTVPSRRIP